MKNTVMGEENEVRFWLASPFFFFFRYIIMIMIATNETHPLLAHPWGICACPPPMSSAACSGILFNHGQELSDGDNSAGLFSSAIVDEYGSVTTM